MEKPRAHGTGHAEKTPVYPLGAPGRDGVSQRPDRQNRSLIAAGTRFR